MKKLLVLAIVLTVVMAAGPATAEWVQMTGFECTAGDGGACQYFVSVVYSEVLTTEDGLSPNSYFEFQLVDLTDQRRSVNGKVESATLISPDGNVFEYVPDYYQECRMVWQWRDNNGNYALEQNEFSLEAWTSGYFGHYIDDYVFPEGDYSLIINLTNGDVITQYFHQPQFLSIDPYEYFWPAPENLTAEMNSDGSGRLYWELDPGYAVLPQPPDDWNQPGDRRVTTSTEVRFEAFDADGKPRYFEWRLYLQGITLTSFPINPNIINYTNNIGASFLRVKLTLRSNEGNWARTQQDYALINDENGFNLIPTTITPTECPASNPAVMAPDGSSIFIPELEADGYLYEVTLERRGQKNYRITDVTPLDGGDWPDGGCGNNNHHRHRSNHRGGGR